MTTHSCIPYQAEIASKSCARARLCRGIGGKRALSADPVRASVSISRVSSSSGSIVIHRNDIQHHLHADRACGPRRLSINGSLRCLLLASTCSPFTLQSCVLESAVLGLAVPALPRAVVPPPRLH